MHPHVRYCSSGECWVVAGVILGIISLSGARFGLPRSLNPLGILFIPLRSQPDLLRSHPQGNSQVLNFWLGFPTLFLA